MLLLSSVLGCSSPVPSRESTVEGVPIPAIAEPAARQGDDPTMVAGYQVDAMSLPQLVAWYERELPTRWREWERCPERGVDRGESFRQWAFTRAGGRGLLVVRAMQENPGASAYILITRSEDEAC
jgi:hypothetical protein